jgi:hypothetical protein
VRAKRALSKYEMYSRGAPPLHPGSAFFVRAKKADGKKRAPVAAPAQNQRECPALLANPEREPNSPADEKHVRSGSNIVSRIPSVSAAVLGLLYGIELQRQLQTDVGFRFAQS